MYYLRFIIFSFITLNLNDPSSFYRYNQMLLGRKLRPCFVNVPCGHKT